VTKKTSKSKKINKSFNNEIIGGVLIIVSVISLLSLFNFQMGIMGSFIKGLLFRLFGLGAYLIPIGLVLTSMVLLMDKFNKLEKKYIILIAATIFLSLILFDSRNISIPFFKDRIQIANELSKIGKGGGIIGSFFGYFFYKLFGKVGGYIIIISIFVFNFIYAFKLNIKQILKDSFTMLKKNNGKDLKNKVSKKKKKNKPVIISQHNENNIMNEEKLDNKKVLKINESKKQIEEVEENINEVDVSKELEGSVNSSDKIKYTVPPIELLNTPDYSNSSDDMTIIQENAKKIEETMENFGIESEITYINKGPTITCYELEPAPGVKLNKIVSLSDNIAMTLASQDIRIEAPIPGKSAVGIEVPNKIKEPVLFKEMILSNEFKNMESNIPLTLGKDVTGNPIISTIDKMPHLLIAGATGSGKSVCINTIIMSIIYKSSPEDTKLLLIDPKVVELGVYNDIPHLLIPVVTDPKKATFALNWAVSEMEKRYKLFAENGVRNIQGYNNLDSVTDKMPSIVIIIDELADLMMVAAKEIESYICRLAQMARAAGMHLILATQRPSVDVITGTIKANIPSRISFAVSSQVDSRTILDIGGAEKLLGKGDMLYYPSSYSKPKRIQGAFISDEEVEKVVSFLKETGENDYNEKIIENIEKSQEFDILDVDPLLETAAKLIIDNDQASISMLQRDLSMGYNRARKIIDDLEAMGIVGGHEGSKPRKVLITEDELENYF